MLQQTIIICLLDHCVDRVFMERLLIINVLSNSPQKGRVLTLICHWNFNGLMKGETGVIFDLIEKLVRRAWVYSSHTFGRFIQCFKRGTTHTVCIKIDGGDFH